MAVAAFFVFVFPTVSTSTNDCMGEALASPASACKAAVPRKKADAGDDHGRRLLVWRQRVHGVSNNDEDPAQAAFSERNSDNSIPPLQSEEEFDKDYPRDDDEEEESEETDEEEESEETDEEPGATGEDLNEQEYDCKQGVDNLQMGWSEAKKEFCCKAQGIGCSKRSPEPAAKESKKPPPASKKSEESEKPAPAPKKSEELPTSSKEESLKESTENGKAMESSEKSDETAATEGPADDGEQADEQEEDDPNLEFDCNAGYDDREKGWSRLKKAWCCEHELVGCSFDCKAGGENHNKGWSDIKTAYCCGKHNIGCPEEKQRHQCVTRDDPLAKSSYLQGPVSKPGTACVFGKDDRDEGKHCILDNGKYGEFGWCYTADGWGSCSKDCPLFGPSRVLYEYLKNLTRRLAKFENQTMQTIAQNTTSPGVNESKDEAGKGEEKPDEGVSKKVDDKKGEGGKEKGVGQKSETDAGGKHGSDDKKDATKGGKDQKSADNKVGDDKAHKGSNAKEGKEESGSVGGK